MQKRLFHLAIICLLLISIAGCTKEKALALQSASLQLMLSTVKAIQSVDSWCSSTAPSVIDLDGSTLDDQANALAKSIIGKGTPTTIKEIREGIQDIRQGLDSNCVESSYPKLNEKLQTLKSGTKALNESLADLTKGYLFSSGSVKKLKPHMKAIFSDLSNLAINFGQIPVQDKTLVDKVEKIKHIKKDDKEAKDVKVKELSIANELKQIIKGQSEIDSKQNDVVSSLLVAAKFAKDILKNIDGWETLTINDILDIMNEWAPLADTLTGGRLSTKKIEGLREEITTYATQIGVLDTTLVSGSPAAPADLN